MEDERRKKILMMRIGVITMIVIIFFLWAYNIKNIWRPINLNTNSDNKSETSELTKFKNDINKQMTEINQRLSTIADSKQAAKNKAGEELLNNLIKETDKISTSTATSTSTSSPALISTPTLPQIKNTGCPPYINCMPTIGAARPCQIPAGCEGITVIAY